MADAERVLKPANENSWYVLMTLYGEQDGEEVDWELHAKNRAMWNVWSCQRLSSQQKVEVAKSSGVSFAEVTGGSEWQGFVSEQHRNEMIRRNGQKFEYQGLPDAMADTDLSNVEIIRPLMMSGAVFSSNVDFNTAKFCGFARFNSATFNKHARFGSASFAGDARFANATFNEDAQFTSAKFTQDARFTGAKFGGAVGFATATFSGDARFASATFNEDVWFDHALFGESAVFHSATFKGEAVFTSAAFGGGAEFAAARFSGGAGFRSATFSGEAEFRSATFSGFVYFPEAEFGAPGGDQGVGFTDCQFGKPTSFRDAKFHARFPDFAGAVLHDKTTLTDTPANWPQDTQSDPAQAKASCATIRHNLGKQGLPEAEHFFFRREMGFAGQIGGWWERLPYRAFGWVSDYGYSILTPFLWLCLLIVGGASVLAWGAQGGAQLLDFWQGLGLSFSSAFNFLGFHKTFQTETVMGSLSPWMKMFSGFQSIAGVIFLFFLGLGLRTRFRMR